MTYKKINAKLESLQWRKLAPERGEIRTAAGKTVELFRQGGNNWQIAAWNEGAISLPSLGRYLTDPADNIIHFDFNGEEIWYFKEDPPGTEQGYWWRLPYDASGPEEAERIPGLPKGFWYGGLGLGYKVATVGVARQGKVEIYEVPKGGRANKVDHYPPLTKIKSASMSGEVVAISYLQNRDPFEISLDIIDHFSNGILEIPPAPAVFEREAAVSPEGLRVVYQKERNDWQGLSLLNVLTKEARRLPIGIQRPADLEGWWFPQSRTEELLVVAKHGMTASMHHFELETQKTTFLPLPEGLNIHTHIYGEGRLARPAIFPDGSVSCLTSSPRQPPGIIPIMQPGRPVKKATLPTFADRNVEIKISWKDRISELPISVDLPDKQLYKKPLEGYTTVLDLHGGPHDRKTHSHNWLQDALREKNYARISLNYPGSTGYGLSWAKELLQDPGYAELAAIEAVWKWAVSSGLANPKKFIIMGDSWGGYLSLFAASKLPKLWKLAIAGTPATDLLTKYKDMTPELQLVYDNRYQGSPEANPRLYYELSPITYVGDLECPVLIFAGKQDPRNPNKTVIDYAKRGLSLGKRIEVVNLPLGHDLSRLDSAAEVIETKLNRLLEEVPTPRAPLRSDSSPFWLPPSRPITNRKTNRKYL